LLISKRQNKNGLNKPLTIILRYGIVKP